MASFREFLETMKKNDDTVIVYVGPKDSIYTGYIYDVGVDCLVMTFERGSYNAVIPLDKIFMVSVAPKLGRET